MLERTLSLSLLSLLFLTGPVAAGEIEIISRIDPELVSDTAGGAASSISADGRFAAFVSSAGNLLPGQPPPTTLWRNVYLDDRQTGARILVSRSSASAVTGGNRDADQPVVSADGRFVVFQSDATNLVAGLSDTNDTTDLFLFDRIAGTTRLVSRSSASATTTGQGPSGDAVISADGRYVSFVSRATDLVAGQNGSPPGAFSNVFLFDQVAGTMALVSHAQGMPAREADDRSLFPSISTDGGWVAFLSYATDLVMGQAGGSTPDVFLYERAAGTVSLASRTNGSSTIGSGVEEEGPPSLSADGRFVAFTSSNGNVVPGQSGPKARNVFVFDRVTESTALASRSHASATVPGDQGSFAPALSADGRYVAFLSAATDLVAGQTSSASFPAENAFLHDLTLGTTIVVSRSSTDPLATANGGAFFPRISGDGSFVVFGSGATNLVAGQPGEPDFQQNLYLFDRTAGTNRRISRPAGVAVSEDRYSLDPLFSTDGSSVAYTSRAADLVAGVIDVNQRDDAFRYSRLADANALLSGRDPGSPAVTPAGNFAFSSLVSADGRFVTYSSEAKLLVAGQIDTNGELDVFLFDRLAGTTALVSHAAGSSVQAANDSSFPIGISLDGRFVTFNSRSTNLVPGQVDSNTFEDVFIYDRLSGTNTLASRSVASPGTAGNVSSLGSRPSPDGRYVPFQSYADDLVPGQTDPGQTHSVFLYDRVTGATELISHASGSPALEPNGDSGSPAVSPDGRYVAFASSATNLVSGPADTNGLVDLFLYDRATGTTILLSRNAAGNAPNGGSGSPAFAGGGRCIAFVSGASDLVPGVTDANGTSDVFLYSFESGGIILVSRAHGAAAAGNDSSFSPAVSAGCSAVVFTSRATDLAPGQLSDDTADLFLREPRLGTTTLLGRSDITPSTFAPAPEARISADGRFAAFEAIDSALVPGQEQRAEPNVFLFDRLTRGFLLASGTGGSATRTGNVRSFSPEISADGRAVVFESAASDLAAGDFNGRNDVFLFSQALSGTDLFTLPPCRLFDTRRPEDGPALGSNAPVILDLDGACGIPATARALVLNVTVVQPTGTGYLTLYPGDAEPPVTATATFAAGALRTNNAAVPLSLDGSRSLGLRAVVNGNGTVHVVLDVAGYFE